MLNLVRRLSLVAGAAAVAMALLPAAARAQGSYPDKPVRVILPFPAGTGVDAVMRLVGERLAKAWGQPVIIDNRPGANGFIAMTAAKRAPADGYTLVQADSQITAIVPHVFSKTIPYHPFKDFDAVAPLLWAHWFIVIPGESKLKDVREFIAEAKARSRAFTYGSNAVGSLMHLHAAMLADSAGVPMTHVPYKETSQAIVDVSRGELDWVFSTGGTAGPLESQKKVRFLAVASPTRHPAYPHVPTMTEAGGPQGFDLRTWAGLLAPKGVPAPILEKISADVKRVLADPEVRDRLSTMAFETWPASRAEFASQVAADYQKYGAIAKQLKVSLD